MSIIGSLLKFAQGERLERLIAKFVDDECEKVDRLVELYLRCGPTHTHSTSTAQAQHKYSTSSIADGFVTMGMPPLPAARVNATQREGTTRGA